MTKVLKRLLLVGMIALAVYLAWQAFTPSPDPVFRNRLEPGGKEDQSRTPVSKRLTVYLCKKVGQDIQTLPVVREMTLPNDKVKRLRMAVNTLLEGPSAEEAGMGYFSEIPPGTVVLSTTATPDGLVLNLSAGLSEGGGTDSMTHRLDQIIRTVLAVEPNTPVFLAIKGQRAQFLGGEGVEVPQPLKRTDNPG